eukprot:Hpha_TRINITY_DN16916_c2_g1::TRINITY_DN16916_c2_g1_i1::g.54956::m.54956
MDATLKDQVNSVFTAEKPDVVVNLMASPPPLWYIREGKFAERCTSAMRLWGIGGENITKACSAVNVKRVIATSVTFCTQGLYKYKVNVTEEEHLAKLNRGVVLSPQTRNSVPVSNTSVIPLPQYSTRKLSDQEVPDVDSRAESLRMAHTALHKHERLHMSHDGDRAVLRLGHLFGPNTLFDEQNGELARLVRGRRIPLVGNGRGVWPFLHVEDAGETVARFVISDSFPSALYNVAVSEGVPFREWLPQYAAHLGASAPISVPEGLVRRLCPHVAYYTLDQRGADLQRLAEGCGWAPSMTPPWEAGGAATAPADSAPESAAAA